MKENAREKILAAGEELVGFNGFNATGIDSVLKAAGVPKGSFYYHFGTKENFGFEIINLFAEKYSRKLDSFLKDQEVPPLERIRNYLEHSIEHLAEHDFTRGCLIGNLGQELADQNERFRARLAAIFADWQVKFTDCLREAQQAGTLNPAHAPEAVASFFLSGWEGAVMRAKVTRSPEPLRQFADMLYATVFVS